MQFIYGMIVSAAFITAMAFAWVAGDTQPNNYPYDPCYYVYNDANRITNSNPYYGK